MINSRLVPALPFFAAVCFVPSEALAQNAWWYDIAYSDPDGWIDSPDDTATVTLYAGWDPTFYAFGDAALSMVADENTGEWLNPTDLLNGPLHDDGTVNGARIDGILTSQRQVPLEGVFANTSNPIKVWTATWRTDNMKPRVVGLSAETTAFNVYTSFDGDWTSGLGTLKDNGAGIVVPIFPAPSSSVPLVAAAAAFLRRRRSP